jgi:maltooligosyltrehalose synthase
MRGLRPSANNFSSAWYLIWKISNLRREHPRIFGEGKLLRLNARGKREANVISYALRRGPFLDGNSCAEMAGPS